MKFGQWVQSKSIHDFIRKGALVHDDLKWIEPRVTQETEFQYFIKITLTTQHSAIRLFQRHRCSLPTYIILNGSDCVGTDLSPFALAGDRKSWSFHLSSEETGGGGDFFDALSENEIRQNKPKAHSRSFYCTVPFGGWILMWSLEPEPSNEELKDAIRIKVRRRSQATWQST